MTAPNFELYLDSAELSVLPFLHLPMVHGVTTNPTLQREAGLGEPQLRRFVDQVLAEGAKAVQVQVKHRHVDDIFADAVHYASWADHGLIIPKIPATREGLQAAGRLEAEGIRCTLTAIYQPVQVLWSLLAGARYAAPYLGRINDSGRDGLAVIEAMQELLRTYRSGVGDCRLLVASVRSRAEFSALLSIGVGAVTVRPALLAELVDDEATLQAEQAFLADVG